MKIVVHMPSKKDLKSNHRAQVVLPAMIEGARKHGAVLIEEQGPDFTLGDVGILWGVTSRKFYKTTRWRNVIRAAYAYRDLDCVVCERGFVKREKYDSAGIGGLGGMADFRSAGKGPARWEKLGVELKPPQEPGEVVLVIGQIPHDTSCQHVDQKAWATEAVERLREAGETPLFRPHPLGSSWHPPGVAVSTRTLLVDLKASKWVETFNSTTGVEALIAGREVRAADPGSMVFEVSDRERWASEIAWAQWTADEMASGLTLEHLCCS